MCFSTFSPKTLACLCPLDDITSVMLSSNFSPCTFTLSQFFIYFFWHVNFVRCNWICTPDLMWVINLEPIYRVDFVRFGGGLFILCYLVGMFNSVERLTICHILAIHFHSFPFMFHPSLTFLALLNVMIAMQLEKVNKNRKYIQWHFLVVLTEYPLVHELLIYLAICWLFARTRSLCSWFVLHIQFDIVVISSIILIHALALNAY